MRIEAPPLLTEIDPQKVLGFLPALLKGGSPLQIRGELIEYLPISGKPQENPGDFLLEGHEPVIVLLRDSGELQGRIVIHQPVAEGLLESLLPGLTIHRGTVYIRIPKDIGCVHLGFF